MATTLCQDVRRHGTATVHVSAAEQTGPGTGVSVGVGEGVVRGECEGRECEEGGSGEG